MLKMWAEIHLLNGKLVMECGNCGPNFVYLKALDHLALMMEYDFRGR